MSQTYFTLVSMILLYKGLKLLKVICHHFSILGVLAGHRKHLNNASGRLRLKHNSFYP